MKRFAIIAVIVAAVGITAMVAFSSVNKMKQRANGDKSNDVTVTRGDLVREVIETGKLESAKTVEVKSRVGGRVAALYVDEGDLVEAGQLVAVIDPEETQLRVEQDRARLVAAEASMSRLNIEIEQRKQTVETSLERAELRVAQLKMELDAQPELTKNEISRAETAYNNAVKSLDLLTKVTQPNARIDLEGRLEEAKSSFKAAENEYNRRKGLFEKGYSSQRDLEAAESQMKSAQARRDTLEDQLERLDDEQAIQRSQAEETVRQAKAALDSALTNAFRDDVKKIEYERALADLSDAMTAKRDVQALEANRAQQKANLDQLQNALNDSLRQLNETEIRAPISGVVTGRLVQEGELVASLSAFSSGTPIFRIEDRSGMLVRLEINEIDVARLELGMNSKIEVDAFAEDEFEGKVTKIAPAQVGAGAQPGSGFGGDPVVKYEVEVTLSDVDSRLKSGMSAKCTIEVVKREDVLMLSKRYVGKDKDGYFINPKVKAENGKKTEPERVAVKIGESSATHWEIVEGAEEGTAVQSPKYEGPDRKGVMQFGNGDDGDSDEEDSE